MGGGTHLPGFPHPHPTTSYWQLPPHPLSSHRTTPSLPTKTFDHIIIGSGISGAATAFKLLARNPNTSILMLEARTAASGASGRNGGHCRAGWWYRFKRWCEVMGEDEAVKVAVLEAQTVRDVKGFVEREGVECDFTQVETVDVFVTGREWAEMIKVVRFRDEVVKRRKDLSALFELQVREGEAARKFVNVPGVVGCVSYPAYTQNPYLLTCRMLELCLEKGLNLQTNTLATRLARSEVDWKVETDRGMVRATNVVLATNGFTNALHSNLAATKVLIPSRSQLAAIRPGEKIKGQNVLNQTVQLADLPTGDYFMSRAAGLQGEGDIVWGGGRNLSETREMNTTDDSVVHPAMAQYLRHAAPGVFDRGAWGEEGAFVREWTGIVAYTADSCPLVGEVPGEKGLWTVVGMNGHGMAMAFRCAEGLVSMLTGSGVPEWFPRSFHVDRVFAQGEGAGHDADQLWR